MNSHFKVCLSLPFLFLSCFVTAQETSDAVPQAIAGIAGKEREAAVKVLVAADLQVSVPALVDCIIEQPTAHAWQAMRVLRRVTDKAGKPYATLLSDAAILLAAAGRDGDAKPQKQQVCWLSIAALGHCDKAVMKSVSEKMASAPSSQVRFAATIAMAGLGKDALPTLRSGLKKTKKKVSVLSSGLCMAAIGMMGPDVKSAKASLTSILKDYKSPSAWMQARTAHAMLSRIVGKRSANTIWTKRRKKVGNKLLFSKKAKLNLAAPVARSPQAALGFFRMQGIGAVKGSPKDYALPKRFEGSPTPNLGEALRQIMEHVVVQLALLADDLKAGEIEDDKQWQERIKGLGLSWDLLRSVLG